MKFFVPAVGFRIRLTQDWKFDLYYEYRNKTLLVQQGVKLEGYFYSSYIDGDYSKGLKSVQVTLPAGTVLEVDRVYVRTMSKSATKKEDDYDSLTFRLIDPKTGKGKIRFWAKLADVNTIEYELPPDFTAGKDAAYARALAPKKFKPNTLLDQVHAGIRRYNGERYYDDEDMKAPAWMTVDVAKQLKAVADEWNRVHIPLDKARFEAERERRMAELKYQFQTGHLSIPLAMRDIIRTFDDYVKHFPHDHYLHEWRDNDNCRKWDYVLNYNILSGYYATCTFSRNTETQECCRTFRPKKDDGMPRGLQGKPDMTHLWVKVYTNPADTEIVRVEAGVDAPKEKAA